MTRERVGAVRDRLARLGGGAWGRGFAESSSPIPGQLRARRRPSSPTARATCCGVLRSPLKISAEDRADPCRSPYPVQHLRGSCGPRPLGCLCHCFALWSLLTPLRPHILRLGMRVLGSAL